MSGFGIRKLALLFAALCIMVCMAAGCSVEKKRAAAEKEFCLSLEKGDDEAALLAANAFLETCDPRSAGAENYRMLSDWLTQQSCVEHASISPGTLDSDPPLKTIDISLRGAQGARITRRLLLSAPAPPEKPRITSIQ